MRRGVPRIPFLSNVTGDWITAEMARDPEYWGRQMREPVRFTLGHVEKRGRFVFQDLIPS